MSSTSAPSTTVLVLGATGATGRYVVAQLLQQCKRVKVIARSKSRMMDILQEEMKESFTFLDEYNDFLRVTEASLLDLSDEDLRQQVQDVDAVVSCLGHNLTFKGIFGHPRKLVTDATRRVTSAMSLAKQTGDGSAKKFILMNSDGVSHPAGTDNQRTLFERTVLSMLRYLIPPQCDNECAAEYLYSSIGTSAKTNAKPVDTVDTTNDIEWVVVRPTDLINGEVTKYEIHDKPQGGLFGSGLATRANVAAFMVRLCTNSESWEQYRFKMPFLWDEPKAEQKKDASKLD